MIFYDYLCGTSGQTLIFTQSTQGGLSGVHDAHGLEVDSEIALIPFSRRQREMPDGTSIAGDLHGYRLTPSALFSV